MAPQQCAKSPKWASYPAHNAIHAPDYRLILFTAVSILLHTELHEVFCSFRQFRFKEELRHRTKISCVNTQIGYPLTATRHLLPSAWLHIVLSRATKRNTPARRKRKVFPPAVQNATIPGAIPGRCVQRPSYLRAVEPGVPNNIATPASLSGLPRGYAQATRPLDPYPLSVRRLFAGEAADGEDVSCVVLSSLFLLLVWSINSWRASAYTAYGGQHS